MANPSAFGPLPQFLAANGDPLVGALLFTYVNGSVSTKSVSFTDFTGSVANPNPIVLDARGEPPSGFFWATGSLYKVVLAPATDSDPPVAPFWTIDHLAPQNDVTAPTTQSQWAPLTATGITFAGPATFTVAGNQTAILTPGRRLQMFVNGGTRYGTILTSVFTTLTTVTMALDSGILDSGLNVINYAVLSSVNPSVPGDLTFINSINGNPAVTATFLKTATNTIAISAATAPTVGQVLTALSTTTAGWQAAGGGGPVLSSVNIWTRNNSVAPATMANAASVPIDASLSNNFKTVAGGFSQSFTLANPTNATDGMVLNFRFRQDAVGSRVCTFSNKYKAAGGPAFLVLSTAPNAVDLMSSYYDLDSDTWDCVLNKAFA